MPSISRCSPLRARRSAPPASGHTCSAWRPIPWSVSSAASSTPSMYNDLHVPSLSGAHTVGRDVVVVAAALKLSLIVPCYNEEQVLPLTLPRLLGLLSLLEARGLISTESDVTFVDDGSRDRTWELIEQASRADARVHGIKLSRNRGHQNALLAGLL